MIVRISFEGIVGSGKSKSTMKDHIDIHTTDIGAGKELFVNWLGTAAGIKGSSGVFHPLATGKVKIVKAESHVA